MGFLLYIISYLFTFLLTPFAVFYTLCRKWNTDLYFKQIAIATDVKGNVLCQYLFNDILIKNGGYAFGTLHETISFVLAKNYNDNTLTFLGKFVCKVLILLKDKAFIN